jgi:hypothetical protein
MKSILFSTVIMFYLLSQPEELLVGKWKIVEFTTIDKIRSSPQYAFADEQSRKLVEQRFTNMLKKGYYKFSSDSLEYTDLDGKDIMIRDAVWSLEDSLITIKEVYRPFERQALLRYVSKDSLVLSLVIEGKAGEDYLIFKKMEE